MLDRDEIQNNPAKYDYDLNMVGVSDVSYPIAVMDKENKWQDTVANVTMAVFLPHQYRGTHMSRFIEILNRHRGKITMFTVKDILENMMTVFQAKSTHITLSFPYFLIKRAPISGDESIMKYDASFIANLNEYLDFVLEIKVPVLILCPCSKEIADRGAHNQRAIVKVQIRMTKLIWIEDIIETVEKCASSPVFSLLKRSDEKYITEYAYDNPRFVEDIVREVALNFDKDNRIIYFSVSCESYESIHNHNAFAFIEIDKRNK
ncbi:MAG: GTP cyclohydrolase FolE2 [bacterium]